MSIAVMGLGILLGGLTSCSSEWEYIELPGGISASAALSLDLWSPYDRYTLLNEAEDVYGRPDSTGSESRGKHYVHFIAYDADLGRIQIWSEAYPTADGWVQDEWLELIPSSLQLPELIHRDLIQHIPTRKGDWKLAIREEESTKSAVTLHMVDDRVIRVVSW